MHMTHGTIIVKILVYTYYTLTILVANLNLISSHDLTQPSNKHALPIIVTHPSNTTVNRTHAITLECRVDGYPMPHVKWYKNGMLLPVNVAIFNRTDRNLEFVFDEHAKYILLFGTDLFIASTSANDTGTYYCEASNEHGSVSSANASVFVIRPRRFARLNEKPTFVRELANIKVELGVKTEILCEVKGYPEPQVEWKRKGSDEILRKGNRFTISSVQLDDEGEYTCQATNSMGSAQSKANLIVYEKPVFEKLLSNTTIGIESKSITIECNARGRPQPVVYWAKSGNLEATSKTSQNPKEEFLILENGNLFIEKLNKNYEGTYLCQATNEYGSVEIKTYLQVKEVQTKPPPIIEYEPQNQTIPINTQAILECKTSSTGSKKADIVWFKGDQQITAQQYELRKYLLDETGSLIINLVQRTDSDKYRCMATNAYGQTMSQFGFLKVEDPNDPYIEFQRSYPLATLPAAPHQPQIIKVTSNSMQIAWQPSMHTGHSQLVSYRIEYFSPEWPRSALGWTVIVDEVDANENDYKVTGLKPDTFYMFVVRARNEFGYGAPSQVSELTKTTTETQLEFRDKNEFIEKELTNGEIIQLYDAYPLGPTDLNITWNVLKAANLIEGFFLKYKQIGTNEYKVVKLSNNRQRSFVIRDLLKFTAYEILIEPYNGLIHGTESNLVQAKTTEAVPDESPLNLSVQVESKTSIVIKWQPPPFTSLNGIVMGYRINCIANETKFNIFLNTNSSTRGIVLGNLVEGMKYCVRVAAYTRVGSGPFTQPAICVDMDRVDVVEREQRTYTQRFRDIIIEPWFIVIGAVVCLLTILIVFYCTWFMYKKIMQNKHSKYGSNVIVEVQKNDNGNRYKLVSDNLWMDTLHSSNNSNQDCCCVLPDISSQLFMQKKHRSDGLQDLNGSLEQRLHNSLKQTVSHQSTNTYNSSKTSELTCISNLPNHSKHMQHQQQQQHYSNTNMSTPSTPSSASPQYAEIYSTNPYASTALFSTDNSSADLINSSHHSANNNNQSYLRQQYNTNRKSPQFANSNKTTSPTILKYDNTSSGEIVNEKNLIKYIQATQSQSNTPRIPVKCVPLSQRIKSLENDKRKEHRTSSLLNNDQIRMQLKDTTCLTTQPPPPPPPRQPPPSLTDTYANNVDVHYNQPWTMTPTFTNMAPNNYYKQSNNATLSRNGTHNHAQPHMHYQIQTLTNDAHQVLLFNQELLNKPFNTNPTQLSYVYHLVPVAVPSNDVGLQLDDMPINNGTTFRQHNLPHKNLVLQALPNIWPHGSAETENRDTCGTQAAAPDNISTTTNTLDFTEQQPHADNESDRNCFCSNDESNRLYITETTGLAI